MHGLDRAGIGGPARPCQRLGLLPGEKLDERQRGHVIGVMIDRDALLHPGDALGARRGRGGYLGRTEHPGTLRVALLGRLAEPTFGFFGRRRLLFVHQALTQRHLGRRIPGLRALAQVVRDATLHHRGLQRRRAKPDHAHRPHLHGNPSLSLVSAPMLAPGCSPKP